MALPRNAGGFDAGEVAGQGFLPGAKDDACLRAHEILECGVGGRRGGPGVIGQGGGGEWYMLAPGEAHDLAGVFEARAFAFVYQVVPAVEARARQLEEGLREVFGV